MSTKPRNATISDSRDGIPVLSLWLTCHGEVTVIGISGELDLATIHLLTELVDRVAADRPARVVLDMAHVTFFCAAGLTALLQAQETIVGMGGQLMLQAPSRITRQVLALTATDRVFLTETPAAA
jgi:anti-anti-sigma factor